VPVTSDAAMVETPERVQIRCLQCSEAFTRRGEQDRFCSARCQRQHSGVRRKAVILMALGAAIFVGFGIAGLGYLGIAGWPIFVGGMFWYGRETLRRD
jgi:predicted nucleic acid-binding Zn ribbon protein